MTTRNEDLDWKLRSFRILPMFVLPAVAFLAYSSFVGFWRMCESCLCVFLLLYMIYSFSFDMLLVVLILYLCVLNGVGFR